MYNNPIFLEYTKAAVPIMTRLKPQSINCTSKKNIETPSLFIRYFHFNKNDILEDNLLNASSHVYYIVNGSGKTEIGKKNPKTFIWKKGDVLILPFTRKHVVHTSFEKAIIFTSDDSPLFTFLSASPIEKRFEPLHYKQVDIMNAVKKFNSEKGAGNRNRNGVLLTNTQMVKEKMNTLTHTMWSLMNMISPKTIQKPHRHNSIAIDLCTDIDDKAEKEESVYTLMSKEIDESGNLIDPIKMPWKKNCTFVTPPGWWHSHHNESDKDAWVFPVQDAGLHTYLRTLDIQFIQP
jgi:gentisate 1,2-dioxygenase